MFQDNYSLFLTGFQACEMRSPCAGSTGFFGSETQSCLHGRMRAREFDVFQREKGDLRLGLGHTLRQHAHTSFGTVYIVSLVHLFLISSISYGKLNVQHSSQLSAVVPHFDAPRQRKYNTFSASALCFSRC